MEEYNPTTKKETLDTKKIAQEGMDNQAPEVREPISAALLAKAKDMTLKNIANKINDPYFKSLASDPNKLQKHIDLLARKLNGEGSVVGGTDYFQL
jgi:hypothetical protein